jgi:hypothetical protein
VDASLPFTYSQQCADDEDCGEGRVCAPVAAEVGGVCVLTPPQFSGVTDPFEEEKTAVPIDFSCADVGPPSLSSEVTTLSGIVDRFGSGPVTVGIEIRVFLASEFPADACDGLENAEVQGCVAGIVDDSDALVASTVSEVPPDLACENIPCETDAECPLGHACAGPKGEMECQLNFGLYSLEGVPVDTPLVVVTRGGEGTTGWHRTVSWDVRITAAAAVEGGHRYDPLIVAHGQWVTVPNPFGVSIALGNGAVGGRLRQCGSEEGHAGWYLHEATVGFANPPAKLGYFNDSEADTLPDPNRVSTNLFGRYTGLDITPGPNHIVAAVRGEDGVSFLGARSFHVYPDTLSVVSLPGSVVVITQPGVECAQDGGDE